MQIYRALMGMNQVVVLTNKDRRLIFADHHAVALMLAEWIPAGKFLPDRTIRFAAGILSCLDGGICNGCKRICNKL